MNIRFLGTGAADFDMAATDHDPMHFRRFSSALIDGTLLIDPGPAVPDALGTFGIDPSQIRFVILTHPHADHFSEESLRFLEKAGAVFVPFAAGDVKKVGKYTVSAFAANHATAKDPVHFLIDDGERRLYYALDGAWLLYDEVQAIQKDRVDLVVFDGTIGEVPGDYRVFEHNNLDMVRIMKQTLSPYVGKFMISHLARTLHGDHESVVLTLEKDGIDVAYDGLTVAV